MSGFIDILACQNKRSLKSTCKSTTVASRDFADFILACKAGITHLNHTMHWSDTVPEHLEERADDNEIFSAPREVQASKQGQAAFRRLFKAHGQRKYNIGHMFISKELQHPISEWHFVFWEAKELDERNNHWVGGSHVHITNYLWPNLYCQDIWEDFIHRNQFPSSKLHVSFEERRK